MGFLQKIDVQLLYQLPSDCEDLCQREGLFVEQAFILLEKQNEEKALQILMSQTNSQNIEKSIKLAIRLNKVDALIQKMIDDAYKDTGRLNLLLQFIDFFCDSQNQLEKIIISSYGPLVVLKEIT